MLSVGERHVKEYEVQPGHTVPDILPESAEFAVLPDVFTTGCLLAVMEWACIEQLSPYLEPGMISLGVGMDMTHDAACTTGTPLVIECIVSEASPKLITWSVEVRSAVGDVVMGRGVHTRAVVAREKFSDSVNRRTELIGGQTLLNP